MTRPLKIRIGIRDTWNAKDKALQLAVRDLAKILGHRIEPEAEWPALWNSTKTSFPDSSTFVPSIAQIAVTWYRQLATRIEQDDQSKWIEELLENLKQAPSENSNTLWVQVRNLLLHVGSTERVLISCIFFSHQLQPLPTSFAVDGIKTQKSFTWKFPKK